MCIFVPLKVFLPFLSLPLSGNQLSESNKSFSVLPVCQQSIWFQKHNDDYNTASFLKGHTL